MNGEMDGRKEGNVLFNNALSTHFIYSYMALEERWMDKN